MADIKAVTQSNNDNILTTREPTGLTSPPEGTYGADIRMVANDISQMTDMYKDYKDQKDIAAATAGISAAGMDVLAGRQAYDQRYRDILKQMDGADAPHFSELKQELDDLMDGKEQGVYSGRQAQLKLAAISTEYQQRYPRVADKIRNMVNAFNGEGDSSSSAISKDDWLSAVRADQAKRAFTAGISVAEMQQRDNLNAENAAVKDQLELVTNMGSMPGVAGDAQSTVTSRLQQDLLSKYTSKSGASVSVAVHDMFMAIQRSAGGMNDAAMLDFSTKYQYIKDAGMRALNDYEAANNVKLDKSTIMHSIFDASDNLAELYKTALSPDRRAALLKLNSEMQQSMGLEAWYKAYGMLGVKMLNSPEGAIMIGKGILKIQNMQKHGMGGAAMKAAMAGDPMLRMSYDVMNNPELSGQFWGSVGSSALDMVESGTPPGATNPAMDIPERRNIIDMAALEAVKAAPSPEKAKTSMANAVRAGIDIPYLASQIDKGIGVVVHDSPDVRAQLDNRFSLDLDYGISTMSQEEIAGLLYSGGRFVNGFKGANQDAPLQAHLYGVSTSDASNARKYRNVDHFVQLLNSYARLRKAYPNQDPKATDTYIRDALWSKIHDRGKQRIDEAVGILQSAVYSVSEDGDMLKNGEPIEESSISDIEYNIALSQIKITDPEGYRRLQLANVEADEAGNVITE